jgi:hypothetical protein
MRRHAVTYESKTTDWNTQNVSLGLPNQGAGWRYITARALSTPAEPKNIRSR